MLEYDLEAVNNIILPQFNHFHSYVAHTFPETFV